MTARSFVKLLFSVAVCQLAGAIGVLFMRGPAEAWYASLKKPFFSPPDWVFAPVWAILYLTMGVSMFLVWQRGLDKKIVRSAISTFLAQLAVNALWPVLFFGFRSPFAGFCVMIVLWLAVFFTIIRFFDVSRAAAVILFPYFWWVSFATALNFAIVYLNP